MTDQLSCPECGKSIDSADELETTQEVAEIQRRHDGTISVYENRDLYLCSGCKRPLGVGSPRGSE